MRVLEVTTNAKSVVIMAKNKKKARKPRFAQADASDTSDDGKGPEHHSGGPACPHIGKAVNLGNVRKNIRQNLTECQVCGQDESGQEKAPQIEEGLEEFASDYWLANIWACLQCGHQGCGRATPEQHALKHYKTPHSVSHSLVVNTKLCTVWCYDCDDEVNAESSKKLLECVEFVRKRAGLPKLDIPNKSLIKDKEGVPQGKESSTGVTQQVASKKPDEKGGARGKQKTSFTPTSLSKVKGLNNLGNTCFFNSVMQSISQTHCLETLLSECCKKDTVVTLHGQSTDNHGFSFSSSSDSEKDDFPLEPLQVSVSESGALTQALLAFLRDMHSVGKSSTLSPNALFGQICKKVPRFKGFQQQDSHELLRHLLDGMKADEIRRHRASILKAFRLPENINPKKVDENTKRKVKAYGKQGQNTWVDSMFGGQLVSTVLCEECKEPSLVFENFLDISLPITEEKPQRPGQTFTKMTTSKQVPRKLQEQNSHADNDDNEKPQNAIDEIAARGQVKSKHQKKKEKKIEKKKRKQKTSRSRTISLTSVGHVDSHDALDLDVNNTEDNHALNADNVDKLRHDSESDVTDGADIEDNADSDVARTRSGSTVDNVGERNSASNKEAIDSSLVCSKLETLTISETKLQGGAEVTSGNDSLIPHVGVTCAPVHTSDAPSNKNSLDNEGKQPVSDLNREVVNNYDEVKAKCNSNFSVANDEIKYSGPAIDKVLHTCAPLASPESFSFGRDTPNSVDKTDDNRDVEQLPSDKKAEHSTHQRTCSSNLKHNTSKSANRWRLQQPLAERQILDSGVCSVASCLSQFTGAELLTGNNKFGCDNCTKLKSKEMGKKVAAVYCNASKQFLVYNPPVILTLHLKRFQQVGYTLRKITRHVEFPTTLDVAPFCSSKCQGVQPGQTKILYSLYGVVEHSGSMRSGHYTGYVKVRPDTNITRSFLCNKLSGFLDNNILASSCLNNCVAEFGADGCAVDGKWYYVSDTHVREVSEVTVLKAQAYLLFYERII